MVGNAPAGIRGRLAAIVGEENVTADPASLASCFREPVEPTGLTAVRPAAAAEVQRIVEHCFASAVPIFTTYDACFPPEVASRQGVLLDFRRMDRIERIDSKNLCAHVQRGVTFEQLEEALRPEGLTALVPAAARTRSVVCHAVARGMNLTAAKYPEVQVSNMQVVLQDGRIHLTGTHAISEEMADWKEDGGPNLSKWYLGADDIFGIVVRGSIWIYPRFEGRFWDAFGFRDLEQALGLLRELPRLEITAECLVVNPAALAGRLEAPQQDVPPWTLVVGIEAFKELADYQRRKAREAVETRGGSALGEELQGRIAAAMQRPWYLEHESCTSYYTLFSRIPELESILTARAQRGKVPLESVGKTFVAHGLGRAVCCRYDFPPSAVDGSLVEEMEIELASAGAFFDRPQGRLAEHVYGMIPAYLSHIKRIKTMMDERRIFNPGRPVKEV
ncbi:MAG: FAD-binding oxidoreductase [bacterium]